MFLNPVFRYNGELKKENAEIDLPKTWIFRSIYLIVLAVIFGGYLRYKKHKMTGRVRN
jgi:hypothetical protein